ncbi:MAG: A/G-specific adenine glycosylase [Candidatus Acidiferrum sp.]|jgi:A/G-specific adenine glycosylase
MMLTGSELRVFRTSLLAWFREFQRDLPWRRDRDAYRVWLSEIMLQQTRVAAVIPYYQKFLARFPSVEALAEAPAEEVLRLWAGLGYYSRARNLQRTAQQIVAKHAGQFPKNESDVRGLPGIGAYTAAAILSIAFGQEHAVLDGNVARVLARIFAIRGDLREASRWQELQRGADVLLERTAAGDWNQAMMELGAVICTPRAPQCLVCPVMKHCAARKESVQEEIPERRKKRAPVSVTLAAAVFVDGKGRTLLLPPPRVGTEKIAAEHVPTLVSKMWHFPTIAVVQDAREEIERHARREFGLERSRTLRVVELARVRHSVTYRQIRVFGFRMAVARLPRSDGAKAVALDDLASVPISNLTRKIARAALAVAAT